jgi:hypothetical protein
MGYIDQQEARDTKVVQPMAPAVALIQEWFDDLCGSYPKVGQCERLVESLRASFDQQESLESQAGGQFKLGVSPGPDAWQIGKTAAEIDAIREAESRAGGDEPGVVTPTEAAVSHLARCVAFAEVSEKPVTLDLHRAQLILAVLRSRQPGQHEDDFGLPVGTRGRFQPTRHPGLVQRVEINSATAEPCSCDDPECPGHMGTCGRVPARYFMLDGWPDSLVLCSACVPRQSAQPPPLSAELVEIVERLDELHGKANQETPSHMMPSDDDMERRRKFVVELERNWPAISAALRSLVKP